MKNYPMFIKDTTDQQVIEASACANTKPLYLFLKKAGGLKFNRWGDQAFRFVRFGNEQIFLHVFTGGRAFLVPLVVGE